MPFEKRTDFVKMASRLAETSDQLEGLLREMLADLKRISAAKGQWANAADQVSAWEGRFKVIVGEVQH